MNTKNSNAGICWLHAMVLRLRGWWAHRKIIRACDDARKRVSAMSTEERAKLYERGLDTIFPGGRWACAHGHFSVWVAKGAPCRLCAAQEESQNVCMSHGGHK